jgi:hypothetical protein
VGRSGADHQCHETDRRDRREHRRDADPSREHEADGAEHFKRADDLDERLR